jgi:hypothetical protein
MPKWTAAYAVVDADERRLPHRKSGESRKRSQAKTNIAISSTTALKSGTPNSKLRENCMGTILKKGLDIDAGLFTRG